VQVLFKTKHSVKADPNSPMAQLQCESCHGPGGNHAQRSSEPIGFFGKNSPATVPQQNEMCLTCHSNNSRVGWHGSIHERRDLACVSCHQIHTEHDQVTDRAEQPAVCYRCHGDIQAAFAQFSAHPVRYAEMTCTSCHAPHDSLFPALLTKPTVNQECYTCHAQMRGPFLWEHAARRGELQQLPQLPWLHESIVAETAAAAVVPAVPFLGWPSEHRVHGPRAAGPHAFAHAARRQLPELPLPCARLECALRRGP
jgi:DmsE family decaheme c-type cytochrome